MKITLKNVKFYERMSEETSCFTADVYVDGKKVFYCKNDGKGGCTDINMYMKDFLLLKEVENYCKSLPSRKYGSLVIESNLENVVDNLFYEWLKDKDKEKQQKKLAKDMLVAIVYRSPKMGFDDYTQQYWRGGDGKKVEISKLLSNPKHKEMVLNKKQKLIDEGNIVLNTNL